VKGNINSKIKKLKKLQKNACFLWQSLLSYSSACDGRTMSDYPEGGAMKWLSVIFAARA
jgi:hypothetical protein